MEYRPFGPEEQDDETTEASPKKRRAGESLFRHLSLLRRKERAEAGGIESDDDTESDEKPKKWRKYFARIFPSIVERPEGDSPEKSGFDPETWLSWKDSKEAPQGDTKVSTEQTAEAPITTGQESTTADQTTEISSSPETTYDHATEGSVENQRLETDPDSEHGFGGEIEGDDPVVREAQASTVDQAENRATDSLVPTELPQLTVENVKERRPFDSSQSVTEQETIIERGVGSALPVAIVGLEYLGRKRADRKLEARINTKLETNNKELNNSSNRQEELARIVRANREQLEQLKRQQNQLEQASATKTKEAQVTAALGAESWGASETTLPSQRPEAMRQAEEASSSRSNEVKQEAKITNERAAESFQPEKILEQVAVAAEQDAPVERVFERSHEVKDDKTVPIGAASVGSVVQAQLSARKQATSTISRDTGSSGYTDGLPIISEQSTGGQYKRAATAGFTAALMIIILGSIAYLMVK